MRKFCASRGRNRCQIQALESRQLLSAGALDTSFGSGGKISTTYSPERAFGVDVAVQSDGKYIVVGSVGADFLISRYNTDGTLDTSFGVTHSGKVDIHVGSSATNSFATTVAIASNGDIVVGGFAGGSEFNQILGVVRLLPSGAPDTSFGSNGQITFGGFGDTIRTALTVQPDGKILLAGTFDSGSFSTDAAAGIARFTVNGSLDKTFGDSGTQQADFGNTVFVSGIAVDNNGTASTNSLYGSIVVVGQEQGDDNDDENKFAVIRLQSNGSFDNSFDSDGKTSPAFTGFVDDDTSGVVIESDNSIVVSGSGDAKGASKSSIVVADYAPNGKLNTTFGSGGVVGTNFSENDVAAGIAIGYTGDILVGDGALGKFSIVAYTPSGVLDTSFGTNGRSSSVTFGDGAGIGTIASAPNRHIIAVGGENDVDVASFFDVAPKISVTSLDPTAGPTTFKRVGKFIEQVLNPASFIVSRDLRLPYDTKVYFTVGGTATPPTLINNKRGVETYTLDGMTVAPGLASKTVYSVDIPANQTFATVTLTPVDPNIPASNTTATFTVSSNALYDSGSPSAQTITILGTTPSPPPTTTTLADTADAYVQDGSDASDNFGTSANLEVKEGSSGVNRISYLTFNLASLGSVNSVKLNLFGELSSSDATNIVTQLFSVATTSWSETGITYNNKPSIGSTVLGSATIANTTPAMYSFDVTAYVKQQLAAGIKTVSFALKDPSGGAPFITFNSKEAGSKAPSLTVT